MVGLNFRCIEQHDCKEARCKKYLKPTGAKDRLYNVMDFFKTLPYIAIAEGELDALTLSSLCGIPAVAAPGATGWKKHWSRCFEDYPKVWLFSDGDKAGRDMATDLAKEMNHLIVIEQAEGEDVNSTYLRHGALSIRKMVGL